MGYLDKLLFSQNVYLKMMLQKYGIYGYAHLFINLRPYFQLTGISQDHFQAMLGNNPQKVLAFL